MNVPTLLQAHKRSLFFLIAILAIGGCFSLFKLPVSLFPAVNFPRVLVYIDVGDRPADLMSVQVTFPIEEAVRSVPGVLSVRSTTSRGTAEVSILFNWGLDMVSAMLQVESAIRLIPNLPGETKFTIKRMDPTVFPVIAYSMTSDLYSLSSLLDIAAYQVKPILSAIDGVARVGVIGGSPEEYLVSLDLGKLNSYGLSISDVAKALSAENVLTSVGRVEDYFKLYLINTDTRLQNQHHIENTVLRSGKDGSILVEDVAEVTQAPAPNWTKVTADGKDAIILNVYQQPGKNTIAIDKEVRAKLTELPRDLLDGIHYDKWYDQSELVLTSTSGVRDAIIAGIFLSTIILYSFLKNLKVTLLSFISVPSVLLITSLIMYFLGMSFDIMTLGGMAAAVGLIIDDTIVMIEHIMRKLREDPHAHHGKVMLATKEFTKPLAGSSLATIIIFLPLAFISGITGSFFIYLSLTMGISLVLSFLTAWLAVPILADHFLNENDARQKEKGPLIVKIQDSYEKIMRSIFKKPWLVIMVIVPLALAAFFCYKHVGSGFMPPMDEGGFIIDYVAPPGTSLTETNRLLLQVEAFLRDNPAVQTYTRRTGVQLGGGVTEANQGDFFVRLKPFPRAPVQQVMEEIRLQVQRSIPILEIELSQLMEDLIGDLTSVPQPIEIKLFSDDENMLRTYAPKVADAIGQVPGVVDVKDGIFLAGDALDIKVDRVKSSLEGMDPETVTQTLKGYLTGAITTQIQQGPKMVNVRVWIPEKEREDRDRIERLLLRAPDGHLFPLKRIADIATVVGQPQITRENLKQMAAVTGRISGEDMGTVIGHIKQVLERPGLLPKKIYYSLGGLYAQQQAAFKELILVFIAAVLLVSLLLLFLYDSFAAVAASLATTLLAGSAVFVGLWATSTEVNIGSLMGLTMIVGIATKMSIFYYSEYFASTKHLNPQEALISAGKNRMRPIAMTTFVTILALFPLAISLGMQQPLAIAIISGLVFELPLVLTVLPILFYTFSRLPSHTLDIYD